MRKKKLALLFFFFFFFWISQIEVQCNTIFFLILQIKIVAVVTFRHFFFLKTAPDKSQPWKCSSRGEKKIKFFFLSLSLSLPPSSIFLITSIFFLRFVYREEAEDPIEQEIWWTECHFPPVAPGIKSKQQVS